MNKLFIKIKSYLLILLGVILLSVGISMFSVPNKIVSGGISGMSTVLFYAMKIPAAFSYFIINIFLLILGNKFTSKTFVLKSLICSGLVSFFVNIFSDFAPLTNDIVLASLFGGVINGIGIGLTLTQNASTGGTEIIGRVIQNFFPEISIGKILLITDFIVITVSLFYFRNISLSLYGILTLFISSATIDLIMHKLNVSKLVFVISDYGKEISAELLKKSVRGITLVNVTGAYTEKSKIMLICALKENELPEMTEIILNYDKNAFIVLSESQQIMGKGFRIYR